jgi:proline iminopeptidase
MSKKAKFRPVGLRMLEVPTVLLLHGGLGADHSTFKPTYSQLADKTVSNSHKQSK